jgi:sigma-B regulation protein RsbU (phosphoserine phosphatase)
MKNRAGRIVGVFQIMNKKRGTFTAADERFLKAVSIPATIAIENARLHNAEIESQRMQRELELAAAIQQQILPKSLPLHPGFQLSAVTRPCREVGGDFYDVIESDHGKLTLAIADVSGKGVASALLVSTFQAALHTYVEFGLPLTSLAMKLNRIIFEDSTAEGFITCVLCTYDPATRTLRYVNAGHNHPMIFRPGAPGIQLDLGGIGLGMLPEVSYGEGEVMLRSNDLLMLYTDGVTEAMNPRQDLYGEARLWTRVNEQLTRHPETIAGDICNDVAKFSQGLQQVDDLTMLLMKVM